MQSILSHLRDFNIYTVLFRLALATASGGIIGYGRTKRKKAAGFRTYMLTTAGAALAVLLSCYEYAMFQGMWSGVVAEVGSKLDTSRYAAQVVSGIGFLAAGTILASAHQQIIGLTTATGLFACVCVGMSCGAGFYEIVIIVVPILFFVLNIMDPWEPAFKRRARNIDLFVKFMSMDDLPSITETIRKMDAQVFELEVEQTKRKDDKYPCAVISIKLSKQRASHSEMLSTLAEMPCVYSIKELVS